MLNWQAETFLCMHELWAQDKLERPAAPVKHSSDVSHTYVSALWGCGSATQAHRGEHVARADEAARACAHHLARHHHLADAEINK